MATAEYTNLNQHFVIDDSSSMQPGWYGAKDPGRMTVVASCVEPVVPKCIADDKDGIDISTINTKKTMKGMTVPAAVKDHIIQINPNGMTYLGNRMAALVKEYWDEYNNGKDTQPKNFIIITDGAANDPGKLIEAILDSLVKGCLCGNPKQLTFAFLQVGSPEALGEPKSGPETTHKTSYVNAASAAKAFLERLDDELKPDFQARLVTEVKQYPKLQEVLDYVKELPVDKNGKARLGPYDIVDTVLLKKGQELSSFVVEKAMYGARRDELDATAEGSEDSE